MKLFDEFERTDLTFQSLTEQDFAFLNRSADVHFEAIRTGLESWFSRFPEEKSKDIRERFRGENGPHSGALLELLTHEFLNAVGTDVKVDPDLNGLTPDFETTCDGTKILLECTVVQPSSVEVGADKREAVIKKAVDSLDAGHFALAWECVNQGPSQPPIKQLINQLSTWLMTLDPNEESTSKCEWSSHGWDLVVRALPFKPGVYKQEGDKAIGVEIKIGLLNVAPQIQSVLQRKAKKYKASEIPYIVVLAHRHTGFNIDLNSTFDNSVADALFGQVQWAIPHMMYESSLPDSLPRGFDGFFGSCENPRNRKVSAILFKRELTLTSPSTKLSPDLLPPWVLYHHPWTERPLAHGILPFATDAYLDSSFDKGLKTYIHEPKQQSRMSTLKQLLNFPALEKEKYQMEGGLWEAIVG